jgi:hypothetical protein
MQGEQYEIVEKFCGDERRNVTNFIDCIKKKSIEINSEFLDKLMKTSCRNSSGVIRGLIFNIIELIDVKMSSDLLIRALECYEEDLSYLFLCQAPEYGKNAHKTSYMYWRREKHWTLDQVTKMLNLQLSRNDKYNEKETNQILSKVMLPDFIFDNKLMEIFTFNDNTIDCILKKRQYAFVPYLIDKKLYNPSKKEILGLCRYIRDEDLIENIVSKLESNSFEYDDLLYVCERCPCDYLIKLLLNNKVVPDEKCITALINYVKGIKEEFVWNDKNAWEAGHIIEDIEVYINSLLSTVADIVQILVDFGVNITKQQVMQLKKLNVELDDNILGIYSNDREVSDVISKIEILKKIKKKVTCSEITRELKKRNVKPTIEMLHEACKHGNNRNTINLLLDTYELIPDSTSLLNFADTIGATQGIVMKKLIEKFNEFYDFIPKKK